MPPGASSPNSSCRAARGAGSPRCCSRCCCSAWSASLTFLFARATGDLRLSELLQARCSAPAGSLFEVAYLLFVVLILAVYGAAAGAIGDGGVRAAGARRHARADGRDHPVRDLRQHARSSACSNMSPTCSTGSTRCSSSWPSPASATGSRPASRSTRRPTGWALGGITYASYNIIGAVVILPVVRHLTSSRDAVIAGR